MRRINNKYKNSGGGYNPAYSLNYKFDSISVAGKVSGTALDLIRRYNDLAKEAQSDHDYVRAEIFRQYAEHYRKIVTDINERRGTRVEFVKKGVENNNSEVDKEQTDDKIETDNVEVVAPAEEKPVTEEVAAI